MIKSAFAVYIQGIKTAIASRMAYRTDYFIGITVMLIWEMVVPMVVFLIYRSGVAFPNWNIYEVLLIQGIFMIAKGISYPCFFGIVWNTIVRVQEGTFDLLLIKPRSALFMALVTGFDAEDLGKLLGGGVLTGICLANLPPANLAQWLNMFIYFILGQGVMFSFAVIMAGTGIKWVGNFRLYEIFDSVTAFGIYPQSIFAKPIRIIISYIIPIAMIGAFPASILLGKPVPQLGWVSLGVAGFLTLSLFYWRRMLASYTSAGG
ncbi:MAG: ABC-2 family transporter protein [Spirochaetaceae bacterium]|jgi:ABC-2 type transport system permease protein|nr:ABC-2 family transporter protein [Spirochaetaceae bacterium]